MVNFIITAAQFLAGISIIVGIHELGHLLFAKLFKMRVNSYTIGFPPKVVEVRWGETAYALGAIPLGGAVEIAGMMDASYQEDGSLMEPQPWEFCAKPAWQRLIVILGGILFNLTSAVCLYIAMAYIQGHSYIPKDELNKYGFAPNALGVQMGFQERDKIVKINGKDFEDSDDIYAPSLFLKGGYYTVYRDGNFVDIAIPEKIIEHLSGGNGFVQPIFPCFIQVVESSGTAYMAGLVAGDCIIALNNQPILNANQLHQAIQRCAGKTVGLTYMRNDTKINTTIAIDPNKKQLGVILVGPSWQVKQLNYSLIQAVSIGFKKALRIACNQLLTMWKLVTCKLPQKALHGPIGIAKIFGHTFILAKFLDLIGLLSIVIALFNLLPIPVLDGGHALCIMYEIILGRRLPNKFIQIAQTVGMLLLLGIMLYAFKCDIQNIFMCQDN